MHRPPLVLVALLPLALLACSDAAVDADAPPAPDGATVEAPATPHDVAASAVVPAPAAASPAVSDLPFAAMLAAGTPYAEAREALLAAGWRPIITPACAENVGGDAAICRELPEIESCSGTGAGYCLMAFADPASASALALRSTGGHADWSARGEAATMRLDRAELEPVAPAAGAACPSADFPTFLEAFAADPAVRAAWTAPLVRVALRYDVGEDSVVVDGAMRAADFAGFPVVHQGDAFHRVDASGAVDLAPLALAITEPDADTRDVAFRYGASEGNTVRFARAGECWRLVADPEAPAS